LNWWCRVRYKQFLRRLAIFQADAADVGTETEMADRTLTKWLKERGFRRSWTGDRSYGPPFLQPGPIAPRGDSGLVEVRERVRTRRRSTRSHSTSA